MNTTGTLSWDLDAISAALKITREDALRYFTDGRRVSFIVERRLSAEVLHGTLALSEGAGYDVLDPEGGKWEVRSITNSGAYFCPSYMVGSGRSFAEAGFLVKLDDIKGYILADVSLFPDVPFWQIPVDIIRNWYKNRQLGAGTKINRVRLLQLIRDIP
jgi:hypothetical protein